MGRVLLGGTEIVSKKGSVDGVAGFVWVVLVIAAIAALLDVGNANGP